MKQILFLSMILSLMGCKNSPPTIYCLPPKFEGVFAVIYSQEIGHPADYRGTYRVFDIPSSGIYLTKSKFYNGDREDLFLMKSFGTYDTLKIFLPNVKSASHEITVNNDYTHDTSVIAVNFRQIIRAAFKGNDSINEYCNFQYELITVGRPGRLNDDSLKVFKDRLDKFLKDSICGTKSDNY